MAVSMINALMLILSRKFDIELRRLVACKANFFVKYSCIQHDDGKIVHKICLRLRNVECGEMEL